MNIKRALATATILLTLAACASAPAEKQETACPPPKVEVVDKQQEAIDKAVEEALAKHYGKNSDIERAKKAAATELQNICKRYAEIINRGEAPVTAYFKLSDEEHERGHSDERTKAMFDLALDSYCPAFRLFPVNEKH